MALAGMALLLSSVILRSSKMFQKGRLCNAQRNGRNAGYQYDRLAKYQSPADIAVDREFFGNGANYPSPSAHTNNELTGKVWPAQGERPRCGLRFKVHFATSDSQSCLTMRVEASPGVIEGITSLLPSVETSNETT